LKEWVVQGNGECGVGSYWACSNGDNEMCCFCLLQPLHMEKHCGRRHISFSLAHTERKCISIDDPPSSASLSPYTSHPSSFTIDMLYYYLQFAIVCFVFAPSHCCCLFAVACWGEGENFFTGSRERGERPNERRPTMNDDRFLLLLSLLLCAWCVNGLQCN